MAHQTWNLAKLFIVLQVRQFYLVIGKLWDIIILICKENLMKCPSWPECQSVILESMWYCVLRGTLDVSNSFVLFITYITRLYGADLRPHYRLQRKLWAIVSSCLEGLWVQGHRVAQSVCDIILIDYLHPSLFMKLLRRFLHYFYV